MICDITSENENKIKIKMNHNVRILKRMKFDTYINICLSSLTLKINSNILQFLVLMLHTTTQPNPKVMEEILPQSKKTKI